MNDKISRFSVVEFAQRNPGTCLITKTPNGPLVDTGLDFGLGDKPRFAGRVYLSVDVVREMAEVAGLFGSFEDRLLAAKKEAYDYGYREGVEEKFGDVTGLVERLHDTADRLGGLAAPVEAAEPEPEGAAAAIRGARTGTDDNPFSDD